ncbi:MAG: stage V sporulation protein AC [Bacillota bacterium]
MGKKQEPARNATQRKYVREVNRRAPRPQLLRNVILAFVTGGTVCVVGQAFTDFYAWLMDLTPQEAGNPAVATMILIGALLTGFGVFDKLAKVAGAGLAVPVTGFANSVVASALEFKKEGLVFGIGGKMFQLAGAVIVFGVVTAFIVGLVSALLP